MTDVFVVLKKGINIQQVVGVYPTGPAARLAARQAARAEPDNYHEMQVVLVELGAPPLPEDQGRTVLYRTRKEYAEKFCEDSADA